MRNVSVGPATTDRYNGGLDILRHTCMLELPHGLGLRYLNRPRNTSVGVFPEEKSAEKLGPDNAVTKHWKNVGLSFVFSRRDASLVFSSQAAQIRSLSHSTNNSKH